MIHALLMVALFLGSLWVAYACLRLAFGTHPHEPEASTPRRQARLVVEIHRHDDPGDEPPAPLAESSAAEASGAPRMH